MNQDRNRDQDMPNRQSNMEQAEGSRGDSSSERGQGSSSERNRSDSASSRGSNSGGITNRPLDRERCEQEQVPDRGESQSDQSQSER
jgi:hypothetical protein